MLEGETSRLEGAVRKGEGRATLRLKKDGQAVVEQVVSVSSLSRRFDSNVAGNSKSPDFCCFFLLLIIGRHH